MNSIIQLKFNFSKKSSDINLVTRINLKTSAKKGFLFFISSFTRKELFKVNLNESFGIKQRKKI